jgi:hypothetical protein
MMAAPADIETLLRRMADPRGGAWSNDETAEIRRGTDEQFERAFRDPVRWSYVVRVAISLLGARAARVRSALRIGAELAEEWLMEQVEFDDNERMYYPRQLRDGHWRFMLWPPKLSRRVKTKVAAKPTTGVDN